MSTGNAKILGIKQLLEARHVKGHNVPIDLVVSKIESAGEVSFMGVIHAATKSTDSEAAVTLTAAGVLYEGNSEARPLRPLPARRCARVLRPARSSRDPVSAV